MFKAGRGNNSLRLPKLKCGAAPRAPKASIVRDGYFADDKDFYKSPEWKRLQTATLKRDGYKCRRCGASAKLHAHHIRSRFKGGADALTNTITYCEDCHNDQHSHNILRR